MPIDMETHRSFLFLDSWACPKKHLGNHFSKSRRNILVVLQLFESLNKRLIYNVHTGWNFSYNALYDLCHCTLSNLACATNEGDNKEVCSPLWVKKTIFQNIFKMCFMKYKIT